MLAHGQGDFNANNFLNKGQKSQLKQVKYIIIKKIIIITVRLRLLKQLFKKF